MRTHVISRLRRPAEATRHDPIGGGYGNPEICGAVRTDGETCGLFLPDHDRTEKPGHWCQPPGFLSAEPHADLGPEFRVDDDDRQPCLYCGVALTKLDDGWHYAEAETAGGGKQLALSL